MILPWMAYSTLVALLFGIAAVALEGPLRERGGSIRGVWLGALAASAALPLVGAFLLPRLDAWMDGWGSAPAAEIPAATSAGWLDPISNESASAIDLDPWLGAFWLAASALVCVGLGVSWIRLRLRGRDWHPCELDGRKVWISADMGPAVVGFVRSRIILPSWVLERTPDERALVLAHEEEHLRAGDPRILLAALLLLCAAPWNPALWWQWKRLRQAVEIDCDQRVLARGLDRRVYSRLLLAVGEHGASHRLAVAALIESRSLLEKRIRIMLSSRPGSSRLRIAGSIALTATCIFAACRADRPDSTPITGTGEPLGKVVPTQMVVGRTYELADLDRLPSLANQDEIPAVMESLYPKTLQDAGIGGTVVSQFEIRADGTPDPASIKILDADREELGAASAKAIESFRFNPGRANGENVRVVIQMPVTWQPKSPPAGAVATPGGRANIGFAAGTVTDAEGAPVAGASVDLADRSRGATTNVRGEYVLRLPPGDYSIVVSATGRSSTGTAFVRSGATTRLNLQLR